MACKAVNVCGKPVSGFLSVSNRELCAKNIKPVFL